MLNKKIVGVFGLSLACSISGQVQAGNLQNFNDPNTTKLLSALQSNHLHVVQMGDSHTAADEMTDAMRSQLQNALGNGGMGWAMPMYFSGQRMALYGYDNAGWQPISSRSQREENYTLGGFIAKPQRINASLTLKAKQFAPTQQFTVSVRQGAMDDALTGIDVRGQAFKIEAPIKNNTWQTVKFTAQLPFTITANQANHSAIGGWWAKNVDGRGAVVSALGINGAELSFWNRWNRSAITQEFAAISPELVILAYGTNEAFGNNLDIDQAREILTDKVRQIRQASPNTAVMIVSAPEALKQIGGQCGTRPIKLSAMQNMQLNVAQTEKTLFWDWQAAMGGSCSMKNWIGQGLARQDGVHFSATGYQKLGRMLGNDILGIAGVKPRDLPTQPNDSIQPIIQNGSSVINSGGYAQICLEGTSECKSIKF